jgi:fluoride exporter
VPVANTSPGGTASGVRPLDLRVPVRRTRLRAQWGVLAAIAAGGAAGALARWGLVTAWPARARGFPWATLVTNVSGCLLIGVLMVLVTEVWSGRRLLRAFIGVGLLGGYTTFSTYTVDVTRLIGTGGAGARTALAYLAGTLAAALLAVHTGTVTTRLLFRRRR